MTQITVLHTIAGLKDRAGGVARSVPGLCEALARAGCRTVLVSQSPKDIRPDALLPPHPDLVETHLYPGYDWERLRLSYTPRLSSRLRATLRETDARILHDHGIWLQMNRAAASAARDLHLPRVVSPRGMLDGWAMTYRNWKKRLAWRAYQWKDLERATAFCATSGQEADGIRALGFRQPIAIIPNGIPTPMVATAPREATAEKILLFMSRLHAKKGLLDLVAAWKRSRKPGWTLVIAGPDEDGHGRIVEAAAASSGISDSVSFTGAVAGEAKRRLLESAQLFVLPSYSENFGIVVGEALACGVPVITTTGTPWSELRDERCGWWIAPGEAALAAALTEAMETSSSELAAMGARGQALITRAYSWSSVAARHLTFYHWLAGDGPKPDDVQ